MYKTSKVQIKIWMLIMALHGSVKRNISYHKKLCERRLSFAEADCSALPLHRSTFEKRQSHGWGSSSKCVSPSRRTPEVKTQKNDYLDSVSWTKSLSYQTKNWERNTESLNYQSPQTKGKRNGRAYFFACTYCSPG